MFSYKRSKSFLTDEGLLLQEQMKLNMTEDEQSDWKIHELADFPQQLSLNNINQVNRTNKHTNI